MEGSRRMKEWEQLQEEIPNLDMALDFVDRPDANIRDVNLSVEEWRVVSYINPKNTIRADRQGQQDERAGDPPHRLRPAPGRADGDRAPGGDAPAAAAPARSHRSTRSSRPRWSIA